MGFCKKCGAECSAIFCSRSCANSFNNSKRVRTAESKKKTSDTILCSLSSYSKVSPCVDCGKICRNKRCVVCTKQFKSLKMKELCDIHEFGGITSKKRYNYLKKDGSVVHLQSSFEFKFAVLLDEMSIEWSRPGFLFWFDSDGKKHRYYPDFKIGEIYVDTKNDYLAVVDVPKIIAVEKHNGVKIHIVVEKQITKEFIGSLV